MAEANSIRFPGETDTYRSARLELLEAEKQLRREVARVATLRQALPIGGRVETDYVFEEIEPSGEARATSLSELFSLPEKSLFVYSFMYADDAPPCPMCTSFLDAFDGVALHAKTQINLAVVARRPASELRRFASERGWRHLRMLSSANNRFNQDYRAESETGSQIPMITVFRREGDAIHHAYSTELFFAESEPGQHPRHVDMVYPLWNLFDFTPEGRPTDWFPQVSYGDPV